ncbi:MAG: inositol monophosphatase family protein [Syntrophaceae bacterium]
MGVYLDFAVSAAREAGLFLKTNLHKRHSIQYKGEINIVTDADRKSEEMILRRIEREFPGHDILSEESDALERGSEFRWIVDPLDGTTNYAHGFPVFCVSIALQRNGEIVMGCIYNPMLDEMFTAEAGSGALLNGGKISVSDVADFSKSFLATGFPYDLRTDRNNNINYFVSLAKQTLAVRRAGSAALDLAYTAAGRFDGFWELKLHPWDTAAALLMVKEAGGKVSDISGREYTLGSGSIAASNGLIHAELLARLAGIDPLEKIF